MDREAVQALAEWFISQAGGYQFSSAGKIYFTLGSIKLGFALFLVIILLLFQLLNRLGFHSINVLSI
jgi:hypothetical protein